MMDEMLFFEVFSSVLLAVMLSWAVYSVSIVCAGVRSKRKGSLSNDEGVGFPKFSIIVPARDEEAVIRRCLGSFLDLDYPRDKLEVIVVDGNSTDSTGRVCSEFVAEFPEVFKVVNERESKGKPGALNLALPLVSGDIVGTFDADSVLDKDALRKAASYFGIEQVMAVQGRTYAVNEKSNILTRVAAMEEKGWYQVLIGGREKLQLFVPLNGSCQFIRRSVLEELGGWDETCLSEDVELAVRLVEKNHLIRYAPDVVSGQETPGGLRGLVKQRVRWYRGYMEVALKYGRLLGNINRKTVDAEISLFGPFMMVLSLLSYFNWFFASFFFSDYGPSPQVAGLVIALTAVSLFSVGVALTASVKPLKLRNLLWVPSIYVYWLLQMCIAGWAFLNLVFRRKRVWSKTVKEGSITSNFVVKWPNLGGS